MWQCFVYNAALDRLELCLGEDVGHFAVEPDVEKKAQEHVQQLGHGLDPHHTAAARPESGQGSHAWQIWCVCRWGRGGGG